MMEPRIVSGMTFYCRFRSAAPIAALKVGPRGGLLAYQDGKWKRVRKTRSRKGAE